MRKNNNFAAEFALYIFILSIINELDIYYIIIQGVFIIFIFIQSLNTTSAKMQDFYNRLRLYQPGEVTPNLKPFIVVCVCKNVPYYLYSVMFKL